MLKNKLIKIIMLALILLLLFSNVIVYASADEEAFHGTGSGTKDPTLNPSFWKPTIEADSTLTDKAGVVLEIINVIGVISSVIVLVVLGIKYMFGSIEEKADFKKAMIPYFIGVFLLAASTTIPNVIFKTITSLGIF